MMMVYFIDRNVFTTDNTHDTYRYMIYINGIVVEMIYVCNLKDKNLTTFSATVNTGDCKRQTIFEFINDIGLNHWNEPARLWIMFNHSLA